MTNAYLGEAEIVLGGQKYTLVLDWTAISQITTEFGREYLANIKESMHDPIKLAKVIEIALKKHHPDMLAEQIIKLSPPIYSVAASLDLALSYAYFGNEEATVAEKTPDELDEDTKKKTQ